MPGAYCLFHGRKVGRLKDILINCGYPLIERFLLMLASSAVLLIGMARWYFGLSDRAAAARRRATPLPTPMPPPRGVTLLLRRPSPRS